MEVLRALVDEDSAELSIRRQCELLGLSRSTLYYEARSETEANLCLMRLIDEQFLEKLPKCFGGRVVAAPQRDLGLRVQQGARAGEVAFVVVRVQQAGRRPAVDVGGQLPC